MYSSQAAIAIVIQTKVLVKLRNLTEHSQGDGDEIKPISIPLSLMARTITFGHLNLTNKVQNSFLTNRRKTFSNVKKIVLGDGRRLPLSLL